MDVNVVKIPEDSDFNHFRSLCDNHDGWDLVYSKKSVKVWTKAAEKTNFKLLKIRSDFPDVGAPVVYDVLHDPEYRKHWDKYMIQGEEIGHLGPNNDICYYSLRSPPPFRCRDFVLQRSWLETPAEMIIFNHSVCHEDYPPRVSEKVIRGVSYLTGYLVRPITSNSCQVTYLTLSDPGGSLPAWVVNKIAEVVSPSVTKKLHKNCVKYPAWKSKHNPGHKPWLFPEQIGSGRIDLAKCQPRQYAYDQVDESGVPLGDLNDLANGNNDDD